MFVPRGWLTVALEQDPRAFAISVDGRHLEGGLAKPSAAAEFEALGRRWRIAVAALPATGWQTALPWIALTGPALLSLLLVIVGRGIRGRRRAERDFERIFHLSPDLLAIAGFDGSFRRVNPAFERHARLHQRGAARAAGGVVRPSRRPRPAAGARSRS